VLHYIQGVLCLLVAQPSRLGIRKPILSKEDVEQQHLDGGADGAADLTEGRFHGNYGAYRPSSPPQ
jgi:hypothetical protein